MKLRNDFSLETRLLFEGVWECWICGQNGSNRGGLELHHITGRNSNEQTNAALVCQQCHSHMGHSKEEEEFLRRKTKIFLQRYEKKFNTTTK